ncbi:MAG: hypothetical protein AAGG11_02080 [Pseudomonadota bacterium]
MSTLIVAVTLGCVVIPQPVCADSRFIAILAPLLDRSLEPDKPFLERPRLPSEQAPEEDPFRPSLRLNDGEEYTTSRTVILDHSIRAEADEYRAAQDSSIEDSPWLPYLRRPSFTLAPGNGLKQVRFQVRNSVTGAQSAIASDDITLQNPRLLSASINNGAELAQSDRVTLSATIEGLATHYRVSESSHFGDTSWQPWGADIEFRLSNYALGNKTVYLQARNGGELSNVVSDSIRFDANTEYVVSAVDAFEHARVRGFTFSGYPDPQSPIIACSFRNSSGYLATLVGLGTTDVTVNPPAIVTCRFDLFHDRQLNPPWRVVSALFVSPSAWEWVDPVTPESPDASFSVRVTKGLSAFVADGRLYELRLLGPPNSDWRAAFD